MICLLHLLQNQPNDGQASLLSTDGTSTPENPYVEDMTSREEHAQQVLPMHLHSAWCSRCLRHVSMLMQTWGFI